VYWHFRDKSDLCAAMCERALMPLETMLSEAGSVQHADPLATLRALAIAALTRLASDPRSQAIFEVMLHESEHTAGVPSIAERKQRERRHCLVHVERVMCQAVSARQLPANTDTALATQAMHAYIGGLMNNWVLDRTAYDLAAAAPALVDAFVAGLRAAPPRTAARASRAAPASRAASTPRAARPPEAVTRAASPRRKRNAIG
jgi:TetR/AcrR family acrAB operon transcriptional repressor